MTYCARTVAENGEKDAFSVISDKEYGAYGFHKVGCEFYDSKRFFSPNFLVFSRLKKTDIVDFETKIC